MLVKYNPPTVVVCSCSAVAPYWDIRWQLASRLKVLARLTVWKVISSLTSAYLPLMFMSGLLARRLKVGKGAVRVQLVVAVVVVVVVVVVLVVVLEVVGGGVVVVAIDDVVVELTVVKVEVLLDEDVVDVG